ncbi:methionine--tRNA ligase [Halothiobacillus diazotrophicus]|uniref:Methionine--tRNA ligase n=1 Tax=Halothiobacillus diazotrophicus TaxID=1860122 RepID=A0A191ZF12_9GAMM|nr:methionine--tRNA ligase [Halothiobacillus diazotrophicus]ANJ66450.1 methionine--tRNA ligase [Halothiobacillus diazotrophicus]
MTRRILVTSALPYANGPLHLGHIIETIQTDIWVRAQKLFGNECRYVCADDAHGTPIMLKAQQEGITPEELIARISASHQADFADFQIGFDIFHSTHSEENRRMSSDIFQRLEARGLITRRTIKQAYDPEKNMFLPDRFIKGTCPKCGAADQYGDNCEHCGATYSPTELKDPRSVLSGATPVERDSEHYFFDLPQMETQIKQWLSEDRVQPAIRAKLQEWFDCGLQPWDISRDAPYFGFEIPGAPGKFFYVWLDAPIGYIGAFLKMAESANLDFVDYWGPESEVELYHFIGKDIAYFHTLFWPAMLMGAGLRTPTAVNAHGFLTLNGEKMSKSRGTFIQARTFLNHLDPQALRYYFAAKLSAGIDDIDLSLDDFRLRVNADLVGKVVNIASRCAGFIHKQFDGQLAPQLADPTLQDYLVAASDSIRQRYERRETGQAMREIMALADFVNQYIDEKKPWAMAKSPETQPAVQGVCTDGLNAFRILMTYLTPVLPAMSAQAARFLNLRALNWSALDVPLVARPIHPYEALMTRVEQTATDALLAATKAEAAALASASGGQAKGAPDAAAGDAAKPATTIDPIAEEIGIEQFAAVDLRIARIVSAEHVEGADKLLRLQLDIGGGQTRQVFAGIKSAYAPEDLVGRHTVMVANLKPRKMKFGMSEGMVLAAGPGGKDLFILNPDEGAQPGMRVK